MHWAGRQWLSAVQAFLDGTMKLAEVTQLTANFIDLGVTQLTANSIAAIMIAHKETLVK